jgi:DNA-binding transcriptional MerR regulator
MTVGAGSGDERLLQIGEVVERVSLSLRTVRYYEEIELVVPAERSGRNFRLYTENQVQRLMLIKQMKPLGFSVQEMRELLEAFDLLADEGSGADARAAAGERIREFCAITASRIDELRRHLERAEDFAQRLRRISEATTGD